MKVALIGTHGVGKTTLCFELAARLKRLDLDVEMVREVARRCPLPINRETSAQAQAWILHEQMAAELDAEAHNEVVICDRSVLDNLCYLLFAAGPQPVWEPLVSSWLATYDLLVKVPLWTTPRWDGVRDTDLAFQRDIDALLEREILARGLSPLWLPLDEQPRWGDLVMDRLRPLLQPIPSLFPEESRA